MQEKAGDDNNNSFYKHVKYHQNKVWVEYQRERAREQREQEDALNAFGAHPINKDKDDG